eukprot:5532369-Amphidinium_carterae.1
MGVKQWSKGCGRVRSTIQAVRSNPVADLSFQLARYSRAQNSDHQYHTQRKENKSFKNIDICTQVLENEAA